jgi:uroporphyrinogen-III synthase
MPQFASALRNAGANVVSVPVYRWHVPDDTGPARRLVDAACDGRLDAVTFTSAPAVHNLFAIAAEAGAAEDLRRAFQTDVVAACVGPVCAAGAREEGIDAPLAPSVGRMGLLVRALTEHFEARRRTLRCGEAELVVQGSMVAVDGEPIELPPDERAVFEALTSSPGAVVPREADLEDVVGRLRARLGPCGAAIRPSPGGGYWLDAG